VFVESYGRVEKGNCAEVVYRLRFRALTVLVDSDYLKFYRNGVIHTEDEVTPDHAVTLVGYDPDTEQFKFKNSWGSNWGINGYGYCTKSIGVCDYAIYPIFSKEKALPKMVCSRR
jgi:C1A family cysteine protease